LPSWRFASGANEMALVSQFTNDITRQTCEKRKNFAQNMLLKYLPGK
jgi:hypothetical protein